MSKFKTISFTLLMISLIPFSLLGIATRPQAVPGHGPEIMLSPEEIQELQAMEQLVEQERAKMTPAQRAEFDNTVAELTRELEKMQPEELDAFISQVIFGQDPNGNHHEQPSQQTHYSPPIPAPSTHTDNKPSDDTHMKNKEKLLTSINAIVAHSHNILEKINSAPDFAKTLKKWVEQKKIKQYKTTISWEILKKNIENLIEVLQKIKQHEGEKEDYINNLMHDADACNAINKLAATLKEYEISVEIDPLGFDLLSHESMNALIKTISGYLEVFNVNNLLVVLRNITSSETKHETILPTLENNDAGNNKQTISHAHDKSPTKSGKNKKNDSQEENTIERLLTKLDTTLQGSLENINQSVLKNIKHHLTDETCAQPHVDTANSYLPNTIKKIKTATGLIKTLKVNMQQTSSVVQKMHTNTIQTTCKKYTTIFDHLNNEIDWIKAHENIISAEKKYAFLAGSQTANTKDIPYPSSLYELQQALKDLENTYKTI